MSYLKTPLHEFPLGIDADMSESCCAWQGRALRCDRSEDDRLLSSIGRGKTTMLRQPLDGARLLRHCTVLAFTVSAVLGIVYSRAEQPPSPCHPNPTAAADEAAVRGRGDIAK